ncbi:ABC transporter ATP-binding protein [Streptococcus orisratti]|uniref:ABC transporter ATP-binding protein n=1 Tax=Streptococcus orisratti TaxID=114652 RepID=UPI003CFFF410
MATILQLVKELKVVRRLFAVGLLSLLLATAGNQLAPLILQHIIDNDLTGVSHGLVLHQTDFLIKLAMYIALLAVAGVLRYGSFRILIACANQIVTNLRNRAYDVMQCLPISYFDDKPAGKIATRIVNDTETLRNQFYNTLLSQIFITLVQVIFIYGILMTLDIKVGMALLLLVPVFYGLQVLYKKATDKPMKDFYDARSEVNTQVNETMNGASIIQLYHQEGSVLENFDKVASQMRNADNRIVLVDSAASWTLTELLKYTVIAGVLTFIGYQFLGGNLSVTAGRLFIYINYVTTLFDLLGMLVRQLPNIQRSLATGRRVMELLDEETETDSQDELEVTTGVVDFDNVSFAYDGQNQVLKNISIHANKGETVALVGHTGSGKSSIMNLLYRFYDPQEGTISIDGQNIHEFSRESVRAQMGIVLQDPYLFTGTIASNVTMDNNLFSDEEIIAALEKVGAGEMLTKLERGIDEIVVEKGAAFSSGERQLIAFARTLIANPKILILDEATSHIDTETEDIIQKAMEVVKEGRTTFIIAHRLSTIQNADQILVLDAGQIVERGTHDQLMQLNGRYAEMQRIQQKV